MKRYLLPVEIAITLLAIITTRITSGQLASMPNGESKIDIALDGSIEFQSWVRRLEMLKQHRYDDLLKNVIFLGITSKEKLRASMAGFHGERYTLVPVKSTTGIELMAPIESGTTGGAYTINLLQRGACKAEITTECLKEKNYVLAELIIRQICLDCLIDVAAVSQQGELGQEKIWKSTADGRVFMKNQCGSDIRDSIGMLEKVFTKE